MKELLDIRFNRSLSKVEEISNSFYLSVSYEGSTPTTQSELWKTAGPALGAIMRASENLAKNVNGLSPELIAEQKKFLTYQLADIVGSWELQGSDAKYVTATWTQGLKTCAENVKKNAEKMIEKNELNSSINTGYAASTFSGSLMVAGVLSTLLGGPIGALVGIPLLVAGVIGAVGSAIYLGVKKAALEKTDELNSSKVAEDRPAPEKSLMQLATSDYLTNSLLPIKDGREAIFEFARSLRKLEKIDSQIQSSNLDRSTKSRIGDTTRLYNPQVNPSVQEVCDKAGSGDLAAIDMLKNWNKNAEFLTKIYDALMQFDAVRTDLLALYNNPDLNPAVKENVGNAWWNYNSDYNPAVREICNQVAEGDMNALHTLETWTQNLNEMTIGLSLANQPSNQTPTPR